MFKTIKAILSAPFKWGYNAVDTRPTGATYRRVSHQLHAVETGNPGEIAFVVGKGLTTEMPVVEVLAAASPAEAANATLKLMGDLRRSKARAINRSHHAIIKANRLAAKAEAASGNAAQGSPGNPIPSSAASGQVGEPVLVPA